MKRLCFSLSADLCIYSYWLSRLRQASHRKMIQSSALRLKTMTFQNLNMPPPLVIQFSNTYRNFDIKMFCFILSDFYFHQCNSKCVLLYCWMVFIWKNQQDKRSLGHFCGSQRLRIKLWQLKSKKQLTIIHQTRNSISSSRIK